MKNEPKIDFDEFVDRLKKARPQLQGDLTNRIMDRIDNRVGSARKIALIDWIRIVSSSAAVAFICLFIYLHLGSPESSVTPSQGIPSHYDAHKLQNLTLSDCLLRLESNREANERFENLKKQIGL